MRRRTSVRVAAIAGTLAALLLTTQLAEDAGRRGRAAAPSPRLGFNDNAVRGGQLSAGRDALLTERVGGQIHRLTFDWRWVEVNQGVYRLEAYDEIYRAMLARGIRPLFVLMFAPHWAWDRSVRCDRWRSDCRFPPAREHYQAWRRVARLLATRYRRAAGIEVWNEPNERIFWQPRPDPVRYAELLREAYGGVKAAHSRMPVISGWLTTRATSSGNAMSLADFASAVLGAGGGRSSRGSWAPRDGS